MTWPPTVTSSQGSLARRRGSSRHYLSHGEASTELSCLGPCTIFGNFTSAMSALSLRYFAASKSSTLRGGARPCKETAETVSTISQFAVTSSKQNVGGIKLRTPLSRTSTGVVIASVAIVRPARFGDRDTLRSPATPFCEHPSHRPRCSGWYRGPRVPGLGRLVQPRIPEHAASRRDNHRRLKGDGLELRTWGIGQPKPLGGRME